jgi:uncharacterized protein YlxP (DUF503 family)
VISAVVTIKIHIPLSHSLKDKRHVVKSLVARLRNNFNVSVIELPNSEKWQIASIAVGAISLDSQSLNSTILHVLDFVRRNLQVEILSHKVETF